MRQKKHKKRGPAYVILFVSRNTNNSHISHLHSLSCLLLKHFRSVSHFFLPSPPANSRAQHCFSPNTTRLFRNHSTNISCFYPLSPLSPFSSSFSYPSPPRRSPPLLFPPPRRAPSRTSCYPRGPRRSRSPARYNSSR